MPETDRFDRLEQPLADLPCPNCLKYELAFLLRCDLGYAQCLQVARCQACGHPFELNGEFEKKIQSLVESQKAGGCPHCGSDKTGLALLCKLSSHRPLAVGFCEDCRREFYRP